MNWATCWYPGVELGLGLPGRSLPGFFPSPFLSFGRKSKLFFLSSCLTPPFFLFLPSSSFFILFPSLSVLLVVLGCRPFHISVGCGRWKENPGKSPHCCSSNLEFPYSTHFLSIFQSPFIIVCLKIPGYLAIFRERRSKKMSVYSILFWNWNSRKQYNFDFIIRSLIHLKLILVYDVRQISNFFFSHMDIQFSWHHFRKVCLLSNSLQDHLCTVSRVYCLACCSMALLHFAITASEQHQPN